MTIDPRVKRVLEFAAKEVGVREQPKGSNRGPRVDEYQRADLLPGLGYAWCASFDGWTMLTALGQEVCDRVFLRSASCDAILAWGRKRKIISTEPMVGASFLCMASSNDATHIGKVEKLYDKGFDTIEGNTNMDGSREGYGVFRRHRKFSSRYLFLNWPKLLPIAATLAPNLPQAEPKPQVWPLMSGSHQIGQALLLDGSAWVPAWKWAHWFSAKLGWNGAMQAVLLNGSVVPCQPRLIPDKQGVNRAWVKVTSLAPITGHTIDPEPGKIMVLR